MVIGLFGIEIVLPRVCLLNFVGKFNEAIADIAARLVVVGPDRVILNHARVEGALMLRLDIQIHLFQKMIRLFQRLVLLLKKQAVVIQVIKLRLKEAYLDVQLLLIHRLLSQHVLKFGHARLRLILVYKCNLVNQIHVARLFQVQHYLVYVIIYHVSLGLRREK